MAVLAYDLAPHIAAFRDDTSEGEPTDGKEARFAVLVYLVLRANKRNRAYPGVDTIVTDTGHSKSRVIAALEWLRIRKAIYNVKADKRVGAEKLVHSNRAVYQLTGLIDLMCQTVKYLYLHPQEIEDHEDIEIGSPIEPTQETQIIESVHLISEIGSPISRLPLYELKESNDRKEEAPLPPMTQQEGNPPIQEETKEAAATAETLTERQQVFAEYTTTFRGLIVRHHVDQINDYLDTEQIPPAWILQAYRECIDNDARTWKYFSSIMERVVQEKRFGKIPVIGKPKKEQHAAGESPATQPQYKDGDCPTCKNIRFVRTASGSMTDCPDCKVTAVRHE